MRVECPTDRNIFIESPILDVYFNDRRVVEAALIKYAEDGGIPPGNFKVYTSWLGYAGITLLAVISGEPWGLQLPTNANLPAPPTKLAPPQLHEVTLDADRLGCILVPANLLHNLLSPIPARGTWQRAYELWTQHSVRTNPKAGA